MADALVNVLIVSALSILCLLIYKAFDNYENAYDVYLDRTNTEYEYLFNELEDCVKCQEITDLPMEEP